MGRVRGRRGEAQQKSRLGAGIIGFRNVVKNQRNEVVATYETAIMVRVEAEGR
ncbi:MAG: hypothetical protein HA491_00805 [Candidatus Verstraetearchaeota archaeon]|nr:hypothetical protein [Candidatus Verstraetearchaeota archaeon]